MTINQVLQTMRSYNRVRLFSDIQGLPYFVGRVDEIRINMDYKLGIDVQGLIPSDDGVLDIVVGTYDVKYNQ